MVDATGGLLEQGSKATLCRCGLSGKKPYCDGNHFRQGWKE
ncbi:MAG: CDGSH iron-sulfur domain-containing protein [Methylocystaceae bacterium]